MEAFFHGLVLAVGLILPLGVQNVFVFTQGAIQPTVVRALPVVVTSSICDSMLIILAVQGVSLFLASFAWIKILLLGTGFVFLVYMGWLTWNAAAPDCANKEVHTFTVKRQILFALTFSLLNPHAILDTIGVIGTSSINYIGDERVIFTMACVLVSWCWFFSLALMGWRLRRVTDFTRSFRVINKASAVFMWVSAIYMVHSSNL